MKKQLFLKEILSILILFSLYACHNHSDTNPKEYTPTEGIKPIPPPPPPVPNIDIENPEDTSGEEIIELIDEDSNSIENHDPTSVLEEYRVILSVDGIVSMNENGVLIVWIGASDVEVSFQEGMVQDETSIPTEIGNYAKITPFAPDFEIVTPNEDQCYKIHPSGSEVRFSLKPKSIGTYNVSVNIQLYESTNCEGAFVPKTSETLSVIVDVNTKKEISKKVNTLGEIVWEKFKDFWGALVALIFGVILFIIRKKIKKKTGYEEEV